jgi:hypothetical protein
MPGQALVCRRHEFQKRWVIALESESGPENVHRPGRQPGYSFTKWIAGLIA